MNSKVITQAFTNEEVIKKSLFIGVCFPIQSANEFFSTLNIHQDLNATHNCWAYRSGNEYRFNDDGEPSGTAGKPILAAIEGAGFDQIGALVIRHYGGIKLGTGGLARAYGGIISRNLQLTDFSYHIPMTELSVQLPFEYSQQLFKISAEYDGQSITQKFNVKGVLYELSLPVSKVDEFKQTLTNICKGNVRFFQSQ